VRGSLEKGLDSLSEKIEKLPELGEIHLSMYGGIQRIGKQKFYERLEKHPTMKKKYSRSLNFNFRESCKGAHIFIQKTVIIVSPRKSFLKKALMRCIFLDFDFSKFSRTMFPACFHSPSNLDFHFIKKNSRRKTRGKK